MVQAPPWPTHKSLTRLTGGEARLRTARDGRQGLWTTMGKPPGASLESYSASNTVSGTCLLARLKTQVCLMF